jgi:predicted negative regulator of RcsB-dependent stress response
MLKKKGKQDSFLYPRTIDFLCTIRLVLFLLIIFFPVNIHAEYLDDIVTEPSLKKVWELIKANRNSEAIEIISKYQQDVHSASQYHFVYAKALMKSERLFDSLYHFRWVYLHCKDNELKELAILERARIYLKLKLYHEAKGSYTIFLKEFGNSKYLKRAHSGLGKSLTGIGLLQNALAHFDKAGNLPEALFGKANVLHILDKVEEANKLYQTALSSSINKSYFQGSDETRYYYGENLRIIGKFYQSKKYLSSIKISSPFKYKAEIGLGIIALKENMPKTAIEHFNFALLSKEKKVIKKALLNLAKVQITIGKIDEAKLSLEEIRHNYFSGTEYDEATLLLSKFYKKEGKINEAISLLKELAFKGAFLDETLGELETILLDLEKKDKTKFIALWMSVGSLLRDSSREQFLLTIAEGLKESNQLFLEHAIWLLDHGSTHATIWSFEELSNFYSEIGDTETASYYTRSLKKLTGDTDKVYRLEAKILFEMKNFKSAALTLLLLKEVEDKDIKLFLAFVASISDQKAALTLYEKAIEKFGGFGELYISLADVLFKLNRKEDAMYYYGLSFQKKPADNWALYRIGTLSKSEEKKKEYFNEINQRDITIKNLSSVLLKEKDINGKLNKILKIH